MNKIARVGGSLILLMVLTVLADAQPGQPPQVTFIDFPGTIQADGKPIAGLIGFSDPEGGHRPRRV